MGLVSLPAQAYEKDKTYKITILHTNDHHGHFWRSEYGEYGLSAQKTLVDGIRKEVAAQGGSVLLLSGGDINTGVPESDLQDAEPDFRGMNLIGYDAMAVGNHEFDNPLTVLRQQENGPNSRSSPPIFTRKAPANACSSRGRCLSVRI
jgi:5'-nucleotidase/UDP-sugar diphosphatase